MGRRFIIGGIAALIAAFLLLFLLASQEPRAAVAVGVEFVHNATYPEATFKAWVTNRSKHPIALGDVAIRFRTEAGREVGGQLRTSSPWQGGVEPPLPGSLRPNAVATVSLRAENYYKDARLVFDYSYEANPPCKAVSRCVRLVVLKFRLYPHIDSDALSVVSRSPSKPVAPSNVWQWLLRRGMLNGRIRTGYVGPWVQWQNAAGSKCTLEEGRGANP
jgi:hypothetical protein